MPSQTLTIMPLTRKLVKDYVLLMHVLVFSMFDILKSYQTTPNNELFLARAFFNPQTTMNAMSFIIT
ncbi:unnamed protein product [Rotaria sp. Silwood1]|nr:unnamed protein product [Rotaria sp. Silwood1]CAF1686530.1 unnamed protein product [Rotaria sp. Silwood1]